jgi:DNA polymerase III subunit gamma/tau
MSLYHKYRPKYLEDIVGNESTVQALQADLMKDDPPHAYLFHGPTGCGKTTLGRIVADALGCKGKSFREIDSADFRGIDTVREIRRQARFKPLEGTCQVWLIDECHKMTNDAQNAILKALEDPSESAYYILATTEPEKLLKTIRGRCSQYQVSPLPPDRMLGLLRKVVKEEGDTLNKAVYDQIVQDSLGHPRNALQILDQVLGVAPEQRLEIAKRQAELQSQTIQLCRALINGSGWKSIGAILQGLQGQDSEGIRRAILGYCNSILLNSDNQQAAGVMRWFESPTYDIGFPGITMSCYYAVHTKGGGV